MAKRYWLMKCEPSAYSIDDLARDGETCWEGVRNFQARNFMRDEMRVGDGVLFYASNAEPSGVSGLAKICRTGYPDHYAWEPGHKYFDARSKPDAPTWYMVDLAFVERFPETVPLAALKTTPGLEAMKVDPEGQPAVGAAGDEGGVRHRRPPRPPHGGLIGRGPRRHRGGASRSAPAGAPQVCPERESAPLGAHRRTTAPTPVSSADSPDQSFRRRAAPPDGGYCPSSVGTRTAFSTSRTSPQRSKPWRPQSRPRRTMTRSCDGTTTAYWPRLPEVE